MFKRVCELLHVSVADYCATSQIKKRTLTATKNTDFVVRDVKKSQSSQVAGLIDAIFAKHLNNISLTLQVWAYLRVRRFVHIL